MLPSHRLVDWTIGASILGWAVVGAMNSYGTRPTAIVASTSFLHTMVGVLFLLRRPASRQGSLQDCLAVIPAVLIGGWVFAKSPSDWSMLWQIVFLAGVLIATTAFYFLGRSFAILPAVRRVVRRGPYSIVRHPAYFGELLMVFACSMSLGKASIWTWVFGITAGLIIIRIKIEERLLETDPAYKVYCQAVRWRLVPKLW